MRLVASSFRPAAPASTSLELRRRVQQVLDVVEHEQQLLRGEHRGQLLRLASPTVRATVGSSSAGSRIGSSATKIHALREVLDELGRSLQREPRLPGPSRAGERQQADVVAAQQLEDLRELLLPADQRRRLHGEVRRPVLERARRRELGVEPVDHELREPLRPGQILEPVLAEISHRDALGQLVLHELARRLREQHLPAVAGRADSSGARHVEADVAGRGQSGVAGVDADPHAELRPGEVALQPRRRPHGAGRAGKGCEERVALGVHDDSVLLFERGVDESSVLREELGVRGVARPVAGGRSSPPRR